MVAGMITSRMIDANGLTFHCLTAGDPSRPLLIMLHGFPEYSGGWEEMLERLSSDYFCVAPDQRGYGRTTGWEAGYDVDLSAFSMPNLVRDAVALVRAQYPSINHVAFEMPGSDSFMR